LNLTQIQALYESYSQSYGNPNPPASNVTSNITLQHDQIEINKTVTWTESVTLSSPAQNVAIEVPADAQAIQVKSDGKDVTSVVVETSAVAQDQNATLIPLDNSSQIVQQAKPTKLISVNQTSSQYDLKFETAAPYTTEKLMNGADHLRTGFIMRKMLLRSRLGKTSCKACTPKIAITIQSMLVP